MKYTHFEKYRSYIKTRPEEVFYSEIEVLIIGSGQLGCMMQESLNQRQIKAVMIPLSSQKTFYDYLLQHRKRMYCKVLLESEVVELDFLKCLQSLGADIVPGIEAFTLFQKKNDQKKWLMRHDIQTSAYRELSEFSDYEAIKKIFGSKFVIKKSFGAYDGKGVYVIRSSEDFHRFKEKKVEINEWYVERLVPFKYEGALAFICTHDKRVQYLPLVRTVQKNGICLEVSFEREENIIDKNLIKSFRERVGRALVESGYKGLITFELFIIDENNFYVNEIAPRVHNSGHYTQLAFEQNQFDLHVLAALNKEVDTSSIKAERVSMYNLISIYSREKAESASIKSELRKELEKLEIEYYEYDKLELKPGRKMGHINSFEPIKNKNFGKEWV